MAKKSTCPAKFFPYEDEEEMEEDPITIRSRFKRQKTVALDENGSQENPDDGAVGELNREESGMPVILMDSDVLDCPICMEPLSPPVFQCDNGHIACSTCCPKLHNNCPSCSRPIGYKRCLAIEKVIESIKVSCGYKSYGCGETVIYAQQYKHEERCMHAPCLCPISNCDFRGSSKELSLHVGSEHHSSAKPFRYNIPFSVSFRKLDEFLIFQGEEDGLLFVLKNKIELVGSAITVVCLGQSSSNSSFSYNLVARKACSSLRLQSQTKCVKEMDEASSSGDFLLVPYHFYSSSSGKLRLRICILNSQSEQVRASQS